MPGPLEPESKKLGGNADSCENKGVAEKATQRMLKTKELQIDGLRDAARAAGTEFWRERLEGRASEAWCELSWLKISGGVRGDNWSEGRVKGRWSISKDGELPVCPEFRLSPSFPRSSYNL